MSKEVDEKVVEMRFDNAQFERNISKSQSSLKKLKKSLDFKGASKSLEDLERSAKGVNMGPLSNAVEGVSTKFSALKTIAIGSLLEIGRQAAVTGKQLVKSLSTDQIASGWSKYNQKTESVQTIMNATGKSIEEVNGYLDKLMWYSDETSYGFTDMTTALATMVSSGGNIDKIIPMLMGVANATAYSGKGATEFSAAMRQLVQSYSTGTLKAQDWRVMEQWGATSAKLKEIIIQTGEYLGTIKKGQVTVANFTSSLSDDATKGWATTEVLERAYSSYASIMEEAYELVRSGTFDTAGEAIESLADKYDDYVVAAAKSAQSAKSFSEAIDATKDAVSSGWMKTFEIIFGNYEEAKTLWSTMAEDLWEIFAKSSEDRNNVLSEGLGSSWDKYKKEISELNAELEDLSDEELKNKGYTREQAEEFARLNREMEEGNPELKAYIESLSPPSGRQNLVESLFNIRDALFLVNEETGKAQGFIAVLKEAAASVFPPMTGERIYSITKRIREFTEKLIPSEETADKLKRTFKGLFSILDIGKNLVSSIFRAVSPILGKLTGTNGTILEITASIGDWLSKLDDAIKEHDVFFRVLNKVAGVIGDIAAAIHDFASGVAVKLNLPSFDELTNGLSNLFGVFNKDGFKSFSAFSEQVSAFGRKLTGSNFKSLFTDISQSAPLAANTLALTAQEFSNFGDTAIGSFGSIGDALNRAKNNISNVFSFIGQAFTTMKDTVLNVAGEIRKKITNKITFAEIFAIGIGTAMVVFTKKIADTLSLLAGPITGINRVLNGAANVLTSTSTAIQAYGTKLKSEALVNVAKAIVMIVASLAALTLLDSTKLVIAAGVMMVLAGGLLAVTYALGKMNKLPEAVKLSGTILSIGGAILLLSIALKTLSNIDIKSAGIAVGAITVLLGEFVIACKILKGKSLEVTASFSSLIGMAISLKVLVSAIKDATDINLSSALTTIGILTGAVLSLIAIAAICRNAKASLKDAGIGILAIAAGLNLMIIAFKRLANVDPESIGNALKSYVTILGMLTLLMLATKVAGKNASSAASMILKISAALALIPISLGLISKISPTGVKRAKSVISDLLLCFAPLIAFSAFSGENASKAGRMILAMSGALLVLTGAIGLLSLVAKYNPEGLTQAVHAIEGLLAVFGILVFLSGFAGKAENVAKTLTGLATALGVMTACVAALTWVATGNPDELKGAVAALSILMGAFSVLVVATMFAQKAAGKMTALLGIVVGLAAVLTAMSLLHTEGTLENAEAISLTLTAMSGALAILAFIPNTSAKALLAIGAMTLVVGGLGAVLGIMGHFNVAPSIETAEALSVLLRSMSAACAVLGVAGMMGSSALAGIGILLVLIGAMGATMAAISALTADNPTVEEDLDRAIIVMEKIGVGLGAVAGGVIEGIGMAISNGLVTIGENLALFMEKSQPFFDGAKDIDADVVNGVSNLASAILAITGASLLDSISSWLTGDKSFEKFGEKLVPFAEGIVTFSNKVKGIDSDAVVAAATAGKLLAEMADTIPNSGGLLGWVVGNNDIDTFGEQLASFGDAIVGFSAKVKDINSSDITAAADAGMVLSEFADAIPNSGGILGEILGNNDADEFGKHLIPFGKYLVIFSRIVGELDTESLKQVAEAGKLLAQMSEAFPNSGGWLGKIVGENDADDFGKKLIPFAKDLVVFSIITKGLDTSSFEAVIIAGNKLSEMSKAFPNSGGWLGVILGENNAYSFGKQLVAFGSAIVDFANITAELEISDTMSEITKAFSQESPNFSAATEKVMSDAIKAIKSFQNDFRNIGKDAGQGLINGLKDKAPEIKETSTFIGTEVVIGLRKALRSNSPSKETTDVGEDGGQGLINGLVNKTSGVKDAASGLGTTVVECVGNAVDSMTFSTQGLDDFVSGAKDKVTDTLKGLADKAGLDTDKLSVDTLLSFGKDKLGLSSITDGIGEAINSLTGETNAANGLAGAYAAAAEAKQKFASVSIPSSEYQFLISHLGDGLSIGFGSSIVKAQEAVFNNISDITAITSMGLDTWKDWLDEKKYYNRISLKEELAGWEILQSTYVAGSKERKEIDREVYRVQNELVESTYQASLDWIEREKYYNRLSTKEELAAYERMQKRYMEGSKERIEIDKQVYTLRNQLVKDSYENSMNWIEEEKYYNRMSLSDELAAYKRVQSRYAKGTEERKKMDREVYRVEKEIYEAQKQYAEDIQQLQAETNQKIAELEEEKKEKIREINRQLNEDIKSLNDEYASSLESRMNSLYQSYGLFDEVEEREEANGAKLLDNLQGQVEEFTDWQRTIDKLSARGVDSKLISELQQMGPASIKQIKALEGMTDTELNRYVSLWEVKHALAKQQAVSELEGLRIETDKKIEQLRIDADTELASYTATWNTRLKQVNDDAASALAKLRDEFGKKVGLIRLDTETELQSMVDSAHKILDASGWKTDGQQLVNGLIEGIKSKREAYLDEITNLALDGDKTYEKIQGIASPAKRWFRYGEFQDLGLIGGLQNFAGRVSSTAANIADLTNGAFTEAILDISKYVENESDIQPTIRPVIDFSNLYGSINDANKMFDDSRAFAFARQTSFAFNAVSGSNELTVNVDNDGVVQELRSLRAEMAEMASRMERMQVVLDSGTLVGELSPGIDESLGQAAVFKGRGN